ncbi:MAG: hypothetical protein ACTHNJ_10495, partial [Frateuria sp.]
MATSSLSALVEAYRAGELSLPALLVDALAERGAVPADQHAAELQWLARMREDGNIDAGVAQLVCERLDVLQRAGEELAPVLAASEVDGATRVAPAKRSTPVASHADEATRVAPAPRPPTDEAPPAQATLGPPASPRPGAAPPRGPR